MLKTYRNRVRSQCHKLILEVTENKQSDRFKLVVYLITSNQSALFQHRFSSQLLYSKFVYDIRYLLCLSQKLTASINLFISKLVKTVFSRMINVVNDCGYKADGLVDAITHVLQFVLKYLNTHRMVLHMSHYIIFSMFCLMSIAITVKNV